MKRTWNLFSSLYFANRGPALVLQIAARAQEMRLALGAPKLFAADGAEEILEELTAHYAPGALDTVYEDVVKFPNFLKTAETIDQFLAQFDLLRKLAERKMGGGRAFPDAFAAALRMGHASSTHNQKALALASTQGRLDLVVASRQMRRPLGPPWERKPYKYVCCY